MPRTGLTDNEGAILALVVRAEPVTAYQIAKLYASPIYNFNTAKGKLYPLIQRLVNHGLLSSTEVINDRRGTHLYRATEQGRRSLKQWVCSFPAEHDLLPDPLRKKLQAFDLLSHAEQLSWVADAREHLRLKLQAVEACDVEAEGPYGRLAQESAQESLQARLRWLARLEQHVANDGTHAAVTK